VEKFLIENIYVYTNCRSLFTSDVEPVC